MSTLPTYRTAAGWKPIALALGFVVACAIITRDGSDDKWNSSAVVRR